MSALLAACDSTSDRITAAAPITSISTYAEDAVAPLVLANHFTGTDAGTAYTAVSDAPSVATVTVAGGRLEVRARAPGTARVTVTAGGAAASQTFTVVTLDPCGVIPPATLDAFPIAAGAVWTFDWTIRRSSGGGSNQVFTDTMTWLFAAPSCRRGIRTTSFEQASIGGFELYPPGSVVQSESEVTLTYATLNRSITRTFARAPARPGVVTVPLVCDPSEPIQPFCNGLTLQAGRGVVEVQYATTRRVSSGLYYDQGTFTRRN